MKNFDSIIPLTSIGNKLKSGKPITFIPNEIKIRTTLRESMPVGTNTFWLDKANALQLYDSANNLFSITPTSVEYVDTIIAKRGLYAGDSTPLSSVLSEYNSIVDENLLTNGYNWSANRAFGIELTNAMNLIGLRMKIKLNDQAFVPAKWHSTPTGNFTTYYSTDNANWTKIADYPVNNSDDEIRWFSDAETNYCYLDFWFGEIINAKYFKVFADHTFLMTDAGNTLSDTFDVVELFGYPTFEYVGYDKSKFTDGLKSSDISGYFTDPNTPESFYAAIPGGFSNWYGYCSQEDSSQPSQYNFWAIKCNKVYPISKIKIDFYMPDANMEGMDDYIMDWDEGSPSVAFFGSNDNIHWTHIENGSLGGIYGDNSCAISDFTFSSPVAYKYIGFEATDYNSYMIRWWDNSEQMEESNQGYFSSILIYYDV